MGIVEKTLREKIKEYLINLLLIFISFGLVFVSFYLLAWMCCEAENGSINSKIQVSIESQRNH